MQNKDVSQMENRLSFPTECFIIGEARTNADNAITHIFGSFYMGFIIDRKSEIVTDFSCTHTLNVTELFLRKLFVGAHFPSIDKDLESCLSGTYGGSSRKAVLSAYRDALKRYYDLKRSGAKTL